MLYVLSGAVIVIAGLPAPAAVVPAPVAAVAFVAFVPFAEVAVVAVAPAAFVLAATGILYNKIY